MQTAHQEYLHNVRHMYSDVFWRVFKRMCAESNVVVDRTLDIVRDLFIPPGPRYDNFPISVRTIKRDIANTCGTFHLKLLHEITVPLTQFNLPGDNDSVTFRFVNPLWAWVIAANNMVSSGHRMHFEPQTMFHESTNQRLYGAGVSYGCKLKV